MIISLFNCLLRAAFSFRAAAPSVRRRLPNLDAVVVAGGREEGRGRVAVQVPHRARMPVASRERAGNKRKSRRERERLRNIKVGKEPGKNKRGNQSDEWEAKQGHTNIMAGKESLLQSTKICKKQKRDSECAVERWRVLESVEKC